MTEITRDHPLARVPRGEATRVKSTESPPRRARARGARLASTPATRRRSSTRRAAAVPACRLGRRPAPTTPPPFPSKRAASGASSGCGTGQRTCGSSPTPSPSPSRSAIALPPRPTPPSCSHPPSASGRHTLRVPEFTRVTRDHTRFQAIARPSPPVLPTPWHGLASRHASPQPRSDASAQSAYSFAMRSEDEELANHLSAANIFYGLQHPSERQELGRDRDRSREGAHF